uniref:Uncharacterized protein n=1 Tax=Myotis myotis TaxID=51298 RepID=A0A7J7Z4W3_MYOMY|nr:hypothetical protein mMyoMyo1_010523 [Myotis myotis]
MNSCTGGVPWGGLWRLGLSSCTQPCNPSSCPKPHSPAALPWPGAAPSSGPPSCLWGKQWGLDLPSRPYPLPLLTPALAWCLPLACSTILPRSCSHWSLSGLSAPPMPPAASSALPMPAMFHAITWRSAHVIASSRTPSLLFELLVKQPQERTIRILGFNYIGYVSGLGNSFSF